MKVIDTLNKKLKTLEGSLIGIGFENELLINTIDKNNKITECNLLDCISTDDEDGKTSKIRIGRIRKKFKKNKPDYIIYNLKSIKDYKDKFVYDSIFLTKKEVIFYDLDNIDTNSVVRRYKRYGVVEKTNCSDGVIYRINNLKKLTKTNEFTNKIKDNTISIFDFISNLLSDS